MNDSHYFVVYLKKEIMLLVPFFGFLILLFQFANSKQMLKSDTSFSETEKSKVQRGRKAEERINLTFPGTKWCGPGNTANGYEDLGNSSEVDKCCRSHDYCDNMAAGETKHGLKNNDYFTRLHCQCDKEFKECLKKENSKLSNYIGSFYFNVRDRCYKEQHPIVECNEKHTKIFLRRCIKYSIDATKPIAWQWFDLPFYDDDNDFQFDEINNEENELEYFDSNNLFLGHTV